MLTNYIKGRKQKLYVKTDKEILNDKKSGLYVIVYFLIGIVVSIWGMHLISLPKILAAIVVSVLILFLVPVCIYVPLLFIEEKRRSISNNVKN